MIYVYTRAMNKLQSLLTESFINGYNFTFIIRSKQNIAGCQFTEYKFM